MTDTDWTEVSPGHWQCRVGPLDVQYLPRGAALASMMLGTVETMRVEFREVRDRSVASALFDVRDSAERRAVKLKADLYDLEHDETPADEAWFRDVLGWEFCSYTNKYQSERTSDGLGLEWGDVTQRLHLDYVESVYIPVADSPPRGLVRRIAGAMQIPLKETAE